MKLKIFQDEASIQTAGALNQLLTHRLEGGLGSFWLTHDNGSEMGFMINGLDAYLHYFPGDGHPGYHPLGPSMDWSKTVTFLADNYEQTPVALAMVIPAELALTAIEEFYNSGSLPRSIQWESLL